MERTIRTVEKSLVVQNTIPIVITAATGIEVLAPVSGPIEYGERTIQNVGANDCFFAVGALASPNVYNGILKASTFDSRTFYGGQSVSVYSTGGTTIATLVLIRRDNNQASGNILPGF